MEMERPDTPICFKFVADKAKKDTIIWPLFYRRHCDFVQRYAPCAIHSLVLYLNENPSWLIRIIDLLPNFKHLKHLNLKRYGYISGYLEGAGFSKEWEKVSDEQDVQNKN